MQKGEEINFLTRTKNRIMILEEIDQNNIKKKGGDSDLRYLSPLKIETKLEKKYCFFEKSNIKYIDYKDPTFLIKFLNAQGKILPRRITGTLQKNQKKLNSAIKRCRQIGLLPFVTDDLR